jgi:hypothetical protein
MPLGITFFLKRPLRGDEPAPKAGDVSAALQVVERDDALTDAERDELGWLERFCENPANPDLAGTRLVAIVNRTLGDVKARQRGISHALLLGLDIPPPGTAFSAAWSSGSVPLSKTGGWRFESSRPCWLNEAESREPCGLV